MKDEIAAAVVFLTQLVKKNPHLTEVQVDQFQNNLASVLLERFKNHWYQTAPSKGQGYRCIRINDTEPVDPVLETAAKNSGMNYVDLGLPNELTLWVDPSEVSCRLGENHGCYTVVAQFRDGSSENIARSPDIDRLLAKHVEKKQADHAKFVLATTTRSNQKDPALRASPPSYSYHTVPQSFSSHTQGWEAPIYQAGDGYYPNNGWESWGSSHQPGSPSSNSAKSRSPHMRPHNRNLTPNRLSNFSSHPSEKFRWGKSGNIAKA